MLLDLGIITTLYEALENVVKNILNKDYIFLIGIGFTALMILFFFIKSAFSYERKLSRATNRLNEWLFKNQTLTESNLVHFNQLMKSRKTPKILRKHWQQYMLYRDKAPSEYMSAYNCIDKPEKTSSYLANIKNFIVIYKITAAVTFFLTLFEYAKESLTLIQALCYSLMGPIIILLLGAVFTLLLRSMQNFNLATLYQNFHIFNRYIDKASMTIPKYVDFEILFTRKEIKSGIPILGEYLEKRARQEQEELEEAQKNAVSHEEYDFSASGVDGSLVLDRAMKESETYLNAKQRLLTEIQQFESEISTLKKNYENTSKDYQRKLQTSKENMERLRQQQEESTNRIEVNYIRKQQQDEVKKQEQLERDQEDATNKFNTEINSLTEEIEKRRADLEEKRLKVQAAMENEYQTFSVKLHKAIADEVEKVSTDEINKISLEKDQYAQAITYLKGEVDSKEEIIEAKDQIIQELQARIAEMQGLDYVPEQEDLSENNYEEYQEQPLESVDQNEETFEEYNEEEYLNGEYDESYVPEEPETEEEDVQTQPEEDVEAFDGDGSEEEPMQAVSTEPEEEQGAEQSDEDGHYDANGYYWFNDKTYYDPNGLYHDLEGNVYDADGNLVNSGQVVEQEIAGVSDVVEKQEEFAEGNEDADIMDQGVDEEDVSQQVNATAEDELNETAESETQEEQNIESSNASQPTQNEFENFDFDLSDILFVEGTDDEEGDDELKTDSEENLSNYDAVSVEQEPKRRVGRPRKEKPAEETPKRRVGRPRKENVEEKPKRSVGRPRKEKTEEKQKRSVGRPKKEDVVKAPKRGVGRPKKTEQKRSVGRPKKVAVEPKRSVGRPKKTETKQAKRKVGRPKKS